MPSSPQSVVVCGSSATFADYDNYFGKVQNLQVTKGSKEEYGAAIGTAACALWRESLCRSTQLFRFDFGHNNRIILARFSRMDGLFCQNSGFSGYGT